MGARAVTFADRTRVTVPLAGKETIVNSVSIACKIRLQHVCVYTYIYIHYLKKYMVLPTRLRIYSRC
jgi:hypothetical protein